VWNSFDDFLFFQLGLQEYRAIVAASIYKYSMQQACNSSTHIRPCGDC
jgi:hypothetical protein